MTQHYLATRCPGIGPSGEIAGDQPGVIGGSGAVGNTVRQLCRQAIRGLDSDGDADLFVLLRERAAGRRRIQGIAIKGRNRHRLNRDSLVANGGGNDDARSEGALLVVQRCIARP